MGNYVRQLLQSGKEHGIDLEHALAMRGNNLCGSPETE